MLFSAYHASSRLLLAILVVVMMIADIQCKQIVPFRKNLDQVLKDWSCKGPQSRLVYLGK